MKTKSLSGFAKLQAKKAKMKKRKKISYKPKKLNLDTIELNSLACIGLLGIHAPLTGDALRAFRRPGPLA